MWFDDVRIATRGRGVLTRSSEVFGLGFLITAFLFGFRHGIDWDHIAATTAITGSQDDRSQALLFGTLYALGHALDVFVIGGAAILLGHGLPLGGVTVIHASV